MTSNGSPGALTIEYGLVINGADGVYISAGSYIGSAKTNLLVALEPAATGEYIANIKATGLFLDGNNGNSDYGVRVAYIAANTTAGISDLTFSGVTSTTNAIAGGITETAQIANMSVVGGAWQGATWCFNNQGSNGFAISGITCTGGQTNNLVSGGIYYGSSVKGPTTTTGVVFQGLAVGSAGIRMDGNTTGVFSHTGDSFPAEILAVGAVTYLEQFANATVTPAGVPNITSGSIKAASASFGALLPVAQLSLPTRRRSEVRAEPSRHRRAACGIRRSDGWLL